MLDELDRADARLGTPPHAVVLASSEKHDLTKFVLVPEDWLPHVATWPGDPPDQLIRADMVHFETPSRGAVFSVGSITFCGSLSPDATGTTSPHRLLVGAPVPGADGPGWAGSHMPGLKALSDLAEGPQQSRVLAAHATAVGVSGALSFGVAGAVNARLGWHWALVPGALGAALAFVLVIRGT